jgi:hypothetical protein
MSYPEIFGALRWIEFGRLRLAHVTVVVFGVIYMGMIAGYCYVVPQLCARPLVSERLLALVAAVVTGPIAVLAGAGVGIALGIVRNWDLLRTTQMGLVVGAGAGLRGALLWPINRETRLGGPAAEQVSPATRPKTRWGEFWDLPSPSSGQRRPTNGQTCLR